MMMSNDDLGKVSRVDQRLASLVKPELALDCCCLLGPSDTIVLCAGFEDRVTEYLSRVVDSGCRNFNVEVVDYLPALIENRSGPIRKLLERSGANTRHWIYDRENPTGAAEELASGLSAAARIFVDISGMSRLLIVQLLVALTGLGKIGSVHIIYAEAEIYPPTRTDVDRWIATDASAAGAAMFGSSGIFGMTIVPELSSASMQGQPIHAIGFPSWNTAQIAALFSEISAAKYSLIYGVPPSPDRTWRVNALRQLNGVERSPSKIDRELSTLDYRETLEFILEVYGRCSAYEKIVISPTGSKLQTIAVALAKSFVRDLQIVYPTPRTFNSPESYTIGVKNVYSLNLAPFAEICVARQGA